MPKLRFLGFYKEPKLTKNLLSLELFEKKALQRIKLRKLRKVKVILYMAIGKAGFLRPLKDDDDHTGKKMRDHK